VCSSDLEVVPIHALPSTRWFCAGPLARSSEVPHSAKRLPSRCLRSRWRGRRTDVIAIVIGSAYVVLAWFVIRAELADQQHAADAESKTPVSRDLLATARVICGWVARRVPARSSPSAPAASTPAVDAAYWPPSPATLSNDEAAIRRRTAEIGAWGSAWLATSHCSGPPFEGVTTGREEHGAETERVERSTAP